MLLISRRFGFNLPLQVLRSAKGFYIGTANDEGPVSRESVEYWDSLQAAADALKNQRWTQRQHA
jgi:hypothetical protein